MQITKQQAVNAIIKESLVPAKQFGSAFAPTNIALCKYWGKRDSELNLPLTSSLSVSLGNLGACTKVAFGSGVIDQVFLNQQELSLDTSFYRRVVEFLDLFRPTQDTVFAIHTKTNIPIAAGLASSACGLAALVKALDDFFAWHLPPQDLSILARLGSGSACRSLWNGFVLWQAGERADGLDSYGVQLANTWPEFRIGLCIIDAGQKIISSREAMQATVDSSPFYALWPKTVATAITATEHALEQKDFWSLGAAAEANALAMHALMLSSTPAIIYSQAGTLECMQKVWRARAEGLAVFFTQDAGPNLKLLFLAKDQERVQELFGAIEIVAPFVQTEQTLECIYE